MHRVLIIINITSLFLLAISLAGCGGDDAVVTPDADRLISEGWAEYGAGNYEDAISLYEEALIEDNTNAEAHNELVGVKRGWGRRTMP